MRITGLLATVLVCSFVAVAPAIADKPDKKHDRHEAKHDNDKKHDKDEGKRLGQGKWSPADLSTEERGDWKNGRPPGWSRGAKRGWGGRDCPPGLAKQGRCPDTRPAAVTPPTTAPWRDALDRLGRWGRDRRFSAPTLDAMLVGFEGAARHGVPIAFAERLVMLSAERGVPPHGIEAITRALAYGADRQAPMQELGSFAEQGVQRNVAADAIALGIYRLVAERR
jgi:hypothetical protein